MVFSKKISDFCSYKIRDPWFKKVWPGRRLVRVGGVPKLTFTKMIIIIWLVVFKYFFIFHPYLGKWSNCWLIFFRWVETTDQLWILIMKICSPSTFKAISSLDGVPKGSCFVQRLIKGRLQNFTKSYAPWLFVETKHTKKNNGMFFRNGHLGMKKDDRSLSLSSLDWIRVVIDFGVFGGIYSSGWWFQRFFMFNPTWGNDPILLMFSKGVGSTTN